MKEHEKILSNLRQNTRSRALSAKMKLTDYKDLTPLAVDASSPSNKTEPLLSEEEESGEEQVDVFETEDGPIVESGLVAQRIVEAEEAKDTLEEDVRPVATTEEEEKLTAASEPNEEEQEQVAPEKVAKDEAMHAAVSAKAVADEAECIAPKEEAAEQTAKAEKEDDDNNKKEEHELVAAAAAMVATETDDGGTDQTRKDFDFAFGLFCSAPPDMATCTQAAAEIVRNTIHQQQPMRRDLKVSHNPNFPLTVCKIEKDGKCLNSVASIHQMNSTHTCVLSISEHACANIY